MSTPGGIPPPALTDRGESTRERILLSGAKVLAERGYSGTTLMEIAARAGTKAGSLYYYFESRDVLIQEIMTRGITETTAHVRLAVDALGSAASAKDRLSAAIIAHVRYLLTDSDIARASIRSIGQAPSDVAGPATDLHRAYGHYLSCLIDDATRDGLLDSNIDSRVLRLLIVGAANWCTAWYQPDGDSSVDEIAELAARVAIGRLAPIP